MPYHAKLNCTLSGGRPIKLWMLNSAEQSFPGYMCPATMLLQLIPLCTHTLMQTLLCEGQPTILILSKAPAWWKNSQVMDTEYCFAFMRFVAAAGMMYLWVIQQLDGSKAVMWVGVFFARLPLHSGHDTLQLGLLLFLAGLGSLQKQRKMMTSKLSKENVVQSEVIGTACRQGLHASLVLVMKLPPACVLHRLCIASQNTMHRIMSSWLLTMTIVYKC